MLDDFIMFVVLNTFCFKTNLIYSPQPFRKAGIFPLCIFFKSSLATPSIKNSKSIDEIILSLCKTFINIRMKINTYRVNDIMNTKYTFVIFYLSINSISCSLANSAPNVPALALILAFIFVGLFANQIPSFCRSRLIMLQLNIIS